MPTVTLTKENNTFDTGAVVINSAGAFVQILLLKLNNDGSSESAFRTALMQFFPTTAALVDLRITRCVQDGGDHVVWREGTEFNTATSDFPSTSPQGLHTLASGSQGLCKFAHLENIEEISVWAKGTGSLRIAGNAL